MLWVELLNLVKVLVNVAAMRIVLKVRIVHRIRIQETREDIRCSLTMVSLTDRHLFREASSMRVNSFTPNNLNWYFLSVKIEIVKVFRLQSLR